MAANTTGRWILFLCAMISWLTVIAAGGQNRFQSVESIQEANRELLKETLPLGWREFCAAPVDHNVMSLYSGINPCDAVIHVVTLNNQSIELPIRALSEIRDFDVNPKRKTLLYVNAYYTEDTYFSVQSHLKLLQTTRRDLNVLVVDFARDLLQLYAAVRHHVPVQGSFVARILAVLREMGVAPKDITVAGHSVGANIAALGAKLFAEEPRGRGKRVGQLIAIDPAVMCRDADVFVRPDVAGRVVVVHGEGNVFGVREPLGSVDIYPNGVGYFPRKRLQPGCETSACSHLYPFVLFMEATVEGVMVPAVKCDSWTQFRQGACDYADTVAIGLKYPESAAGVYFCMTQPNPPFTFMEHGLRYRKTEERS